MHTKNAEGENRRGRNTALINNLYAIQSVVEAVEGTIGPKGMDCMIVDEEGQFIITNDGVTILMKMDITHPAALMMVSAAYAQESQVGDGTTTMSVMAGAMLESAFFHVQKGVPIHKILEGIQIGTKEAIRFMKEKSTPIGTHNREMTKAVASVAGRGEQNLVQLIYQASLNITEDKMKEKNFRFSNCIMALEGTENEVVYGVIIHRKPLNFQSFPQLTKAKVMVLDDALKPEVLTEELMNTESGFNRYMENRNAFEQWLQKMIDMKVTALFTDRNIDEYAEQILCDAGIMTVVGVLNEELMKLATHTGAIPMKRNVLNRDIRELESYCGYAENIYYDPELEHIRITGGSGEPMTTIVVSAATGAVTEEKERVAKDAASALQAAIQSGVVTGGGTIELACALELEKMKNQVEGMSKYGIECVIEGLKKTMYQIIENAGLHPLEKLEQISQRIKDSGNIHLGINCDSGEVEDLFALGILDPTLVKITALKAASEVSEAVLKINLIVKGKNL